jgi:Polysaccharide lyase family 4, domain II
MVRAISSFARLLGMLAIASTSALAQSYQVVSVSNGGTISGTVKWTGPAAPKLEVAINKDAGICDPDAHRTRSLERLVVGPDGGVANTIVYLKNVTSGKAMDLPEPRRKLDQKHCRYEPHILLVPQEEKLSMKSSDAVLHTVHSDGAATFNLAFPFTDHVTTQSVNTAGLINLKCNGGHSWMNAEVMVVSHPYYAVTGEDGRFELTNVPPGDYQLVAWHEGWSVQGKESALDVFSQKPVQRIVFSDPKTWEQSITVKPNTTTTAKFTITQK